MTLTQEDIKIIKDIVGDGNHAEYHYQWSMFDRSHQEQYCIRTDDKDQFDELVKEYKAILQAVPTKAFPDDTGPVAVAPQQVQPSVAVCPIHLKPYRDGKYGKFCATKLQDGTWCKEKPKG